MNKTLVFDLDGTIADFYKVPNWLAKLQQEDESPYVDAKPIYNMKELAGLLNKLKGAGWHIVVTSWLSKGASAEFSTRIRTAKKDWLSRHGFPYDEIHLIRYGATKANSTRKLGGIQILIDDNEKVRAGWSLGPTIDANRNILNELRKLV